MFVVFILNFVLHSMSLRWKDRFLIFFAFFFFWLLKGFTKLIVLFDFRKLQHYCEKFKRDILEAILWVENSIFNLRFFRDFKFFAFKPVSGINCYSIWLQMVALWLKFYSNSLLCTCCDLCCLGTCCSWFVLLGNFLQLQHDIKGAESLRTSSLFICCTLS